MNRHLIGMSIFAFKASGSDWVPGYLSLHQTAESLLVKWTPNDLMSGSPDEQQMLQGNEAITIDTLDVVYVHCHHKGMLC